MSPSSIDLDDVMDVCGLEKAQSKMKKKVLWICEVDGELMVLQKLVDWEKEKQVQIKEKLVGRLSPIYLSVRRLPYMQILSARCLELPSLVRPACQIYLAIYLVSVGASLEAIVWPHLEPMYIRTHCAAAAFQPVT